MFLFKIQYAIQTNFFFYINIYIWKRNVVTTSCYMYAADSLNKEYLLSYLNILLTDLNILYLLTFNKWKL